MKWQSWGLTRFWCVTLSIFFRAQSHHQRGHVLANTTQRQGHANAFVFTVQLSELFCFHPFIGCCCGYCALCRMASRKFCSELLPVFSLVKGFHMMCLPGTQTISAMLRSLIESCCKTRCSTANSSHTHNDRAHFVDRMLPSSSRGADIH